MTTFTLQPFSPCNRHELNALAIRAFSQFRDHYADWDGFVERIGNMAALAESGEIIVATTGTKIVGAVAYVGPDKPKADFFDRRWPIMRMLVVDPTMRGAGVGRALAEACVNRGIRDGANLFALHTSTVMTTALPMYLRMGFTFLREAPSIHGVPYGIYVKKLSETKPAEQ